MTTAILDTNVILQSTIGRRSAASALVVDAYLAGQFRLVFSQPTIDELMEVFSNPRLKLRHQFTDSEILNFIELLMAKAQVFSDVAASKTPVVRDVSDQKFVALAWVSQADFLVTNDQRDLIPLGRIGTTEIVTPGTFLNRLAENN